jgi:hypothetical protein
VRPTHSNCWCPLLAHEIAAPFFLCFFLVWRLSALLISRQQHRLNMEEDKIVQLGFLEQAEDPARLSDFEYLPDKVGGKPVRNRV